jgi:hypothetical protein
LSLGHIKKLPGQQILADGDVAELPVRFFLLLLYMNEATRAVLFAGTATQFAARATHFTGRAVSGTLT